jgi:hypothetical protein
MKLSSRLMRRVIIALVFLAVFFLFGYGTKKIVETPPSCTDGIKNGQEEGVDCGLFACGIYCEPDLDPPQVLSAKLIPAENNDYDFVAEIANPHQNFGASEVEYELVILDNNDEEILKEEGVFYVLPGQNRFLVISALEINGAIKSAELIIKSAKWQKIDSLEGLNFTVRGENYIVLEGGRSSELTAAVTNESDFDFDVVDIAVLLFDSKGDVIAVHRSDIRTFVGRTARSFKVSWPFSIIGNVSDIGIIISTNLFDNSNFIKTYGSGGEQFQQYEFDPYWR